MAMDKGRTEPHRSTTKLWVSEVDKIRRLGRTKNEEEEESIDIRTSEVVTETKPTIRHTGIADVLQKKPGRKRAIAPRTNSCRRVETTLFKQEQREFPFSLHPSFPHTLSRGFWPSSSFRILSLQEASSFTMFTRSPFLAITSQNLQYFPVAKYSNKLFNRFTLL